MFNEIQFRCYLIFAYVVWPRIFVICRTTKIEILTIVKKIKIRRTRFSNEYLQLNVQTGTIKYTYNPNIIFP